MDCKTEKIMEQNCPEFLAFQRNYVILFNLRHGIESITTSAFAAEIINRDLKNKCTDKNLTDTERTRCLLDAIEGKMLYRPETFQKFVKILRDDSGFEYIADYLTTSLEEAKAELEEYNKTRRFSYSCATTPTAKFPGNSKLPSVDGAMEMSSLDLQRKWMAFIHSNTPGAAFLPRNSLMPAGGELVQENPSPVTGASHPGNLDSVESAYRDASSHASRRSGLKLPLSGIGSLQAFYEQQEGRSSGATTPPAVPTRRPILERRYGENLRSQYSTKQLMRSGQPVLQ